MSLTENEQKVLEHINTWGQTYGRAPVWIAWNVKMTPKEVKAVCDSLHKLGHVDKQGNGRYKAKKQVENKAKVG